MVARGVSPPTRPGAWIAETHGEVRALAELGDEREQDGSSGCDQRRIARASGEAKESPAEAVGEGVWIARDKPLLIKRRQRA